MSSIALFYMSKVSYGGFVSFTYHLCKAFREMGHDCNVYKIRNTTERKLREFCGDVQSRNVSLDDALKIIDTTNFSIVTATFWRGWKDNIMPLIIAGAEVVIHDHTDYTKEFKDFMQSYGVLPIVIRQVNKGNLRNDGLDAVYIPHPYVESELDNVKRDLHAISVCRLDYDKRSDIIIKANELLPLKKRIHIWGTHTRMYMFQKIVGKYKGWDDNKHYTGPMYPREQQHFPKKEGYAVQLNSSAGFSCDMSAIKHDGGGTQYSFLEAMNGGAVLVLNKGWFNNVENLIKPESYEMIEDENCVVVENAEDLADFLSSYTRADYMDIVDNYSKILYDHSPKVIIPKYMKFLKDVK